MFPKKISGEHVCNDLYFLLLIILNVIFLSPRGSCYWKKIERKRVFFSIKMSFFCYRKALEKKLPRKKIVSCHERLLPLLVRLLHKEEQAAGKCFLDRQHIFLERDWFSEKPKSVSFRQTVH